MTNTSKKILVIDDNKDNLLALKALINDLFSECVTYVASGGHEGIEMAGRHHPDVILLDIIMPGMDGFQVCKILKADKNLCDIPVVFVTAMKENHENKVRALETGAEGFITKPIDMLELVAQIKAMLKIKAANDFRKTEKQRLEDLVNERTRELQEIISQRDSLAKHIPGVIYQYRLRPDGTSHFPYASEGIREIYGVSPEKASDDALCVFEALHPDDHAGVSASILESARTMTTWHSEYRVNLPKGQTIWVEGESTPQAMSDGSILWHGYIRDITERKRNETAQCIQLRISRFILSAQNIHELLKMIREELNLLFETTNFIVARYYPDSKTLKQLFFADENDSFEEWTADRTFTGQVVKTGNTIFLKGDEIPAFCKQYDLIIKGTSAACWVGIPVFVNFQVFAVLVLQHYSNPNAYVKSDVMLLEIVAHEISLFIERQLIIDDLINAREKVMIQLRELQRWHDVMLDREDRIIELKREVNKLLTNTNHPPRYLSVENESGQIQSPKSN